jgi:hypothetical protein
MPSHLTDGNRPGRGWGTFLCVCTSVPALSSGDNIDPTHVTLEVSRTGPGVYSESSVRQRGPYTVRYCPYDSALERVRNPCPGRVSACACR